ncbi:MAG: SCO family protein [Gemmatimonadota bacterium]
MTRRILQIATGASLGLIVALLVARSQAPAGDAPAPDDPVTRALLPDPFPAPPLRLRDPDGAPVSLNVLRGSVAVLFFGYTHCPDVCPLTLATLGRIQDEGDVGPVEVVFVSIDPERDTPRRLRDFSDGLPGRIRTWTADGPGVRDQANAYGVVVRRPDDSSDPDYLVDHTARTFVLDPDGRVVATLPPMVSAEEARAVLDAVRRRYAP